MPPGKLLKIAIRFLIRFYSDPIFFTFFFFSYDFFLIPNVPYVYSFFLKYFKFLYNIEVFVCKYVIQPLAAKYVNKVSNVSI